MHSKILSIALPMMLANLSTPLLGLVDTAILGHLDSAVYLGAVAVGAQLITLVFWSFGFLRMGTTGFAARHYGSGNFGALARVLKQAALMSIVASLFILFAQSFSLSWLIGLLIDRPELQDLALSYTEIRIWGAPAALLTYALIGWMIGIQRAAAAMVVLVSLNILNIALDYLFIVRFGWRSDGAAWASLISEYVGSFLALLLCFKAAGKLNLDFSGKLGLSARDFAEMLVSARHLFVRTLCLIFCFLYFAAQGEKIGVNTLAANAILLNLLAFTACAMDGFAYTAETLAGEAWGAKNRQRFVQVIRSTWLWAVAVGVFCTLVLLFTKSAILHLYTDIEAVLGTASSGYLWLALLPLVACHCYQLDGIFIAVGKTLSMQNAMLTSCFLVFLPTWLMLQDFGNTGLWAAFWALHVARSLFLLPNFYQLLKQFDRAT